MSSVVVFDMDQVHVKFLHNLHDEHRLNEGQGTFCYWVDRARKGHDVYIAEANIDCRLARFKLGYEQDIPFIADVLVQWNDATTLENGTKYLEHTITLSGSPIIHLAQSLEDPDVIMYIGTPEAVMNLVRAYSRKTGKRVKGYLSALGAVCGELCAVPMVTQEPSLSICCGGSRKRLFKNNEIAVAFPAKLASVVNS